MCVNECLSITIDSIERYNITNFLFWSDIFNLDREWTIELCKKIIDNGLKITWSANSRANTMDDEMASWMYKSGCRLVSIGVESGSQEVLDNIGKKITLDDIRNTVKILKKNRIQIYNYFVIGLPWETEKTVEETINFAIELDSNFISFYTATPLPGTRFFAYAMMNKLIEGQLNFESAYYVPTIRSHELSKERIFELHKQAIKRFYLRPKFILKTLFSLRSFTEFKNCSWIKVSTLILVISILYFLNVLVLFCQSTILSTRKSFHLGTPRFVEPAVW